MFTTSSLSKVKWFSVLNHCKFSIFFFLRLVGQNKQFSLFSKTKD